MCLLSPRQKAPNVRVNLLAPPAGASQVDKGLGLSAPLINMALGPKQFGRWLEGCEILVEDHVDFLKRCPGNGDLPQRLFLRFYQILSSVSNSLRSIYKLIKVPIN